MAGLVPAIHAFPLRNQGVDARHKAGHDEVRAGTTAAVTSPMTNGWPFSTT